MAILAVEGGGRIILGVPTVLKTNSEWQDWGRRDPLHGVATWSGKGRDGPAPWTDEEFYRVGALDWDDFGRHWMQFGLDPTSCVEIGCGAGRITRQLAGVFVTVVALDVSEEMIEYARDHVPENVSFATTSGDSIPLVDGAVTAAFSSLVFQHFDHVSDAERYFREIHRVLAPGGSLMVQLPIYEWPDAFVGYRGLYAARRALSHARARIRRLRLRIGRQRPFFRYLRFEQSWVRSALPGIGFRDLELRTIELRTHDEWLTFVFARKPPS